MDQVVVLEVLEKSGKVKDRIKLDRFPVSIGRGYGNDVILDDDYVSPEHLSVERTPDGKLIAVDLKSANGLFVLSTAEKVAGVELGSETLLRIGRTWLRFRKPEFGVGATSPDRYAAGVVNSVVNNGWVFVCMVVLAVGVVLLDNYADTATRFKAAHLGAAILPIGVIVIWAGCWALAARIFTQQSSYFAHGVIACAAIGCFLALSLLIEYYSFAFSADVSAEVLRYAGVALIIGSMLYWHLRVCALRKPKYLIPVAGLLGCAFVALLGFGSYVANSEFSDSLDYSAELKPLWFKWVTSATVDGFIKNADSLKRQVDSLAKED